MYNWNITPHQNIIDLVNRNNSTQLQVADFSFSIPKWITAPGAKEINTTITLTALPGTGLHGEREVFYRRINLKEHIEVHPATFITQATTLHEALPDINRTYGLGLTTSDCFNEVIEVPQNGTRKSFVIHTRSESLLFVGDVAIMVGETPTPDVDAVTRRHYLVLGNVPVTRSINKFICIGADGRRSTDFVFLSNTKNITQCDISKVVQSVLEGFLVYGSFAFDLVDVDGGLIPVVAGMLVVDSFGTVKGFRAPGSFDVLPPVIYHHPAVSFTYAIDSIIGVKRYDDSGHADIFYSAELPYLPVMLRVLEDGHLLTVSPMFTGDGPFIPNQKAEMLRIDKLLPSGNLDPLFMPITVSTTSIAFQDVIVSDIAGDSDGNIFVLFGQQQGLDTSSPNLVINGKRLIPLDFNPEVSCAWNPVVKFTATGHCDDTFKHILGVYKSQVLYGLTPDRIPGPDEQRLIVKNGVVTVFVNRINPITGFLHVQPVQFNRFGDLLLMDGEAYLEQYKWTLFEGFVAQSNGLILAYGEVQTASMGLYGRPYSSVCVYNANGIVKGVLWKDFTDTIDSSAVVSQIFILEHPNV